MTSTVFPMFQTQYILDFLSASRSSGTLGFDKHCDFQSKDVASEDLLTGTVSREF
jgi:hypothetical protein